MASKEDSRQTEADTADVAEYDAAKPQVSSELKAGEFSTLANYKVGKGTPSRNSKPTHSSDVSNSS
jgi:hypothetical protein